MHLSLHASLEASPQRNKKRSHTLLVAPYCAIPRDYLSDTPLLRAMGFLVSQHGQMGAIPPPPFVSVSPFGEHAKWRCDTPPSKGGISAIPVRCPMKTRQMGAIPPSAILFRDGETTIKLKFSVFEGGGALGGREENRPKHCFSWETPRQ